MRVGVPRETKDGERRVGMTPAGVARLVADGHTVVVERGAGEGAGFADADYAGAGASPGDAGAAFACDLVVKVKELQATDLPHVIAHSTILGFAQLNRDPALLAAVLAGRVRIVAAETVRDARGGLPLLAPMSRIAGRLAPLAGAMALCTDRGGAGVLACGVEGAPPARVLVLGAGTSGTEAARIAARLGCIVRVYSRGEVRLARLRESLAAERLGAEVATLPAYDAFARAVADADLVIGAVLEPGRLSPKLVTRDMLRGMRRGSALVDIGIDQGGIAETSRMTKLSAPTYVEEGVVHYAVPNMPALVARTATLALAHATLPCVRALAGTGIAPALRRDPGLAAGLMAWDGQVVHPGLAADTGRACAPLPWLAERPDLA
jgi:alanine dehydrogenase